MEQVIPSVEGYFTLNTAEEAKQFVDDMFQWEKAEISPDKLRKESGNRKMHSVFTGTVRELKSKL